MSDPLPARLMMAQARSDSDPEAPLPPAPPERRGDLTDRRRRLRRRRRVAALLALLLVLVAAAGTFAAVRLSEPDPAPSINAVISPRVGVEQSAVDVPWPATGQGAVAIPSIGVHMTSGLEKPAPVASLTKLMTAYVILHDHPLSGTAQGPDITISQADVNDYNEDVVNNDSSVPVVAGEQLTEREALSGLLVRSADNYADLLATWDAGNVFAFVDKMNADAARLGMHDSHFVDPSGVNPFSQSTAGDLLKVAVPDMTNPVFATLVRMTAVLLPLAGIVATYTPLLGVAGTIGVKSGFTSQAGGGDVLAIDRMVHGVPTLVITAVTGQTGPDVLAAAGLHALDMANTVDAAIRSTVVLRGGEAVARVSEGGRTAQAGVTRTVSVLAWPGATVSRRFRPRTRLTDQARRGASVGAVDVTLGAQRVSVPVVLESNVPRPTLLQRLF